VCHLVQCAADDPNDDYDSARTQFVSLLDRSAKESTAKQLLGLSAIASSNHEGIAERAHVALQHHLARTLRSAVYYSDGPTLRGIFHHQLPGSYPNHEAIRALWDSRLRALIPPCAKNYRRS